MPKIWTFGDQDTHQQTYSDGTQVPHLEVRVLEDGVNVGFIEIHMHKHKGRDGQPDFSAGITVCVERRAP